jgi:hypothetical protein
MHKAIATLLLLWPLAASADDAADITALASHYVADLSPSTAELCTADAMIFDGVAPYRWKGPDACENWRKDMLANAAQHGVTGAHLVLGVPNLLEVTGDEAYASFPATMTFQADGKSVSLPGSTLTLTLHKVGSTWKITGWSYAEGAPPAH